MLILACGPTCCTLLGTSFCQEQTVCFCLQEIPTAPHRALQLTQIVTNDKNAHGEHKPCVLARALETWRCPVSAFGEQMLARYASVTEMLAAQSSAQLRKHVIFSRKDDFTKTMALDPMRESTAVAMEAAGHMCRPDKHQAVTEGEPRLRIASRIFHGLRHSVARELAFKHPMAADNLSILLHHKSSRCLWLLASCLSAASGVVSRYIAGCYTLPVRPQQQQHHATSLLPAVEQSQRP